LVDNSAPLVVLSGDEAQDYESWKLGRTRRPSVSFVSNSVHRSKSPGGKTSGVLNQAAHDGSLGSTDQ